MWSEKQVSTMNMRILHGNKNQNRSQPAVEHYCPQLKRD
jgi:hypothetical protein